MRKRRGQRIITYTLSALLVFSLFNVDISVYAESEPEFMPTELEEPQMEPPVEIREESTEPVTESKSTTTETKTTETNQTEIQSTETETAVGKPQRSEEKTGVFRSLKANGIGNLADADVITINIDDVTDNGDGYTYHSQSDTVTLLKGYTFIVQGTSSDKAIWNEGAISGGNFSGGVWNSLQGAISGGTFSGAVYNYGDINGGTFSGEVNNNSGGTISGGTFSGTVYNHGDISVGTFSGTVYNDRAIRGGYYLRQIDNMVSGTITGCNYPVKMTLTNLSYTTYADKIEIDGTTYTFAKYSSSSEASGISIVITAEAGYFVPDYISFSPDVGIDGYTYTKSSATNATLTVKASSVSCSMIISAEGTTTSPAPKPTVTIASQTASTLTVEPLPDQNIYGTALYSLGNNEWQSSNTFTGLKASQSYTVYAKYTGKVAYTESEEGSLVIQTNVATYTITIPESATAGGDEVNIQVDNDSLDLGAGGQVDVKVTNGINNGMLTLTRENAANTITSAMKVNGLEFKDTLKSVATFKSEDNTAVPVSFEEPKVSVGETIPAGSYSGTVTFGISYSQ
ncbi:hypothetical protein HGO97_011190 [Faecalicatena sp. AGMB00832]|uniref:Ig-like domain-containing protein n=1 Tax=Faecalicatena faecalis TaxID=2726362 RepID=A0ABS6D4A5_9FIRM|nr:hypothetical protein [Faecalicatena faecalis]MBU3876375.1 hypothetical protein [Faecalicatena faecalis]